MRIPARGFWPGMIVVLLLMAVAIQIPRLYRSSRPLPEARRELPPGTAFAIPLEQGRAVINLPRDAERRFLLIVSSLGEPVQREQVQLSAAVSEETGNSRLAPVLPVSPLRTAGTSRTALRDTRQPEPAHSRKMASPAAVAVPHAAASPGMEAVVDWNRPASALADGETVTSPGTDLQPPVAIRTFQLHVTDGDPGDARQYTTVTGQLAGCGRQVQVYADTQLQPGELAPGLVEEIVRLFDTSVCPQVCGLLGSWNDVDDDGRFTVLLSPWLGKLQGGRTSVGGFVRQADFSRSADTPLSNNCDMMYLNSSLRPGRHLETLLLHEFTHAVCFSQRGAGSTTGGMLPREEDWLNEAIAHAVETRFGGWSNLDYRISRYLNHPAQYPLVVPDYYTAGLWRNHGCRGATSLFLEWLQQRYGPQILRQLVREPASGTDSLERVTGVRFPALYRRFTLALAGAEPGPPATTGIRLNTVRSLPENKAAAVTGSVRGLLNGWGLAGPRTLRWNPGRNPRHSFALQGTSTAWIEITGSPTADDAPGGAGKQTNRRRNSSWQLVLQGRKGSRLQATLVPLERQPEQFELLAEYQAVGSPAGSSSSSPRQPELARISRTAVQPVLRAVSPRQAAPAPGVVTAGYSPRFRVPAVPTANSDSGETRYTGDSSRAAGTGGVLVRIGPVSAGTESAEEAVPRTTASAAPEVLLLACEWHDGDNRQTTCLTGDHLAAAAVNQPPSPGSVDQPAWREYVVPFAVRGASGQPAVRTLTLKAIVRDSRGTQHVLWHTLNEADAGGPSDNTLQLAAENERRATE